VRDFLRRESGHFALAVWSDDGGSVQVLVIVVPRFILGVVACELCSVALLNVVDFARWDLPALVAQIAARCPR